MIGTVALFAASAAGVRAIPERYAARADTSSDYALRAWIGAHLHNLTSLLAPTEPYLLVVLRNRAGRPALVIFVDREWPHAVTSDDGKRLRWADIATRSPKSTEEKSR